MASLTMKVVDDFFQEPDLGVGAPGLGEEGYYVPPTKGTSQTHAGSDYNVCTSTSIKCIHSTSSIPLSLEFYVPYSGKLLRDKTFMDR